MANPELRQHLLQIQQNKALVSVYTDANHPTRFAAGWIEAISDDFLLLRSVAPSGHYDGFALRAMSEVFRVDHGDHYAERLTYLYQAREQHHPKDFTAALSNETDLLTSLLLAAQRQSMVVNLDINNDEVWGWVKHVGAELLILEKLDEDGAVDGETVLAYADILAVNVDDEELQDLKLLAQRHSNLPPDWLNL